MWVPQESPPGWILAGTEVWWVAGAGAWSCCVPKIITGVPWCRRTYLHKGSPGLWPLHYNTARDGGSLQAGRQAGRHSACVRVTPLVSTPIKHPRELRLVKERDVRYTSPRVPTVSALHCVAADARAIFTSFFFGAAAICHWYAGIMVFVYGIAPLFLRSIQFFMALE